MFTDLSCLLRFHSPHFFCHSGQNLSIIKIFSSHLSHSRFHSKIFLLFFVSTSSLCQILPIIEIFSSYLPHSIFYFKIFLLFFVSTSSLYFSFLFHFSNVYFALNTTDIHRILQMVFISSLIGLCVIKYCL